MAITEESGGCICQGCSIKYLSDLIVPDDVWERIKPEGKAEGAGLLCPNCIMHRLMNIGWSCAHVFRKED